MSSKGRLKGAAYERLKHEAFDRDGWRCVFCGTNSNLTPAHLIRVGQDGEDTLENIMCACVQCHGEFDRYERGLPPIVWIRLSADFGNQYILSRMTNP